MQLSLSKMHACKRASSEVLDIQAPTSAGAMEEEEERKEYFKITQV